MEVILTLVILAAMGWVGFEMAKTRNRNPTTWAIICVLTGVFGIAALALIGTAKEEVQ